MRHMRTQIQATVWVLILLPCVGCGPSAEERYAEALELLESEQTQLDRMIQEREAYRRQSQERIDKLLGIVSQISNPVVAKRTLEESKPELEAIEKAVAEELQRHDAGIQEQQKRVAGAEKARDEADRNR